MGAIFVLMYVIIGGFSAFVLSYFLLDDPKEDLEDTLTNGFLMLGAAGFWPIALVVVSVFALSYYIGKLPAIPKRDE